jgi:hypothetical protein
MRFIALSALLSRLWPRGAARRGRPGRRSLFLLAQEK